jgi:hypothetical protein
MHKSTMKDRVNASAWDRLGTLFPSFFHGDSVRADWG